MEKLLFEIGTEEIPAKFMPGILAQLQELAEKKMTELQKRAIRKINQAGGIACRVESVEDVKRVIERVDLERSDTNA